MQAGSVLQTKGLGAAVTPQPPLIPVTESGGCPRSPAPHPPPTGPSHVPVGPLRVPQPAGMYLVLCDEAVGLYRFLPLQKYHVLQRGEGEGLRGDATGHWGRKGDMLRCSNKPGWKNESSGKPLQEAAAALSRDRATASPLPCHPALACATRWGWWLPRAMMLLPCSQAHW